MKNKLLLLFSAGVLFLATANAQDYALCIKAGTLGINVEVMRSLGRSFNARIGAAFFNYSMDSGGGTDEDFTFSGKLKLNSYSLLADWFPFSSSTFRFTMGALYNQNKGELILIPTQTYNMGGTVYSPEDLGAVNTEVIFNKISPYLGIGFGNPARGDAGVSFTFDIGAIYHGEPKANMKAEGLLAPTAEQGPVLQENIKWFKFYPVLSFGIAYTF